MKYIILIAVMVSLLGFAYAQGSASCTEKEKSTETLTTSERFAKANSLLANEEYKMAIVMYDSLNKDFPQWSCPWRHKGEAYYKLKDYPAATKALEEAIATNENHYDAYVWLAYALNEQKLYKEALQNLELAMKLTPEEEESKDEEISKEHIDKFYKELQQKVQGKG
ncbi:MAG: tetratricopeptide repeat protein [Candidatus Cloacimonas sp.]|jgi:tetratricopeptide (TPR) repeat protein|nr:tetratricopeptide repeat protein [Candidatus Cloacimonas sp.]